jgi:GYF domain 2
MANYKVIGGDLKQYGPVSGDDLRKWIADGRLNAMSLVQVHGDIEWKPLSSFPEFADVLTGRPAGLIPPLSPLAERTGDGHQAVLQRVKAPAIGLKVSAIISLIVSVWSLFRLLFFPPNMQELNSLLQRYNDPQLQSLMQKIIHIAYGPAGIANALIGVVMSALILMGAARMQSLRGYEFAMTAATLSVVPCLTPCCGYVLGLIFGIWALVILAKPDVKSQFT